MNTVLLIACSRSKHPRLKKAPAAELYMGTLFRYAMRLARERGWTPWILSALYGFITPEQEIETYDLKMPKRYTGPWPKGSGYYVGGRLYFGSAPARFRSFAPEAKCLGQWIATVRSACKDHSPLAKSSRKRMPSSVTGSLFQFLEDVA